MTTPASPRTRRTGRQQPPSYTTPGDTIRSFPAGEPIATACRTLLVWLAEEDGPEAYHVIRALSDGHGMPEDRSWLQDQARRMARRHAQREPWTERQLVNFERDCDLDPATPGQLHHLIAMRLRALKEEVEHSDFGGIQAFAPGPDEAEVQKYVAQWLLRLSRGRYHVVREEEVADEKRTDIRLRRTEIAGLVTIEVKRAEAWTLEEIRLAIEAQLVDRYMRPDTSRHGFMLVACMAKPRWRLGGKPVPFEEGIAHLSRAADELLGRRPEIRALQVVGIDMRRLVKLPKR